MELVSLQGCNIVLIVIGVLALVIEAAMSAVLGTILIVRASLQGKHVPKSTLGEPLDNLCMPPVDLVSSEASILSKYFYYYPIHWFVSLVLV